jgi:phenylalanyl-tRNA synthetase beta chain
MMSGRLQPENWNAPGKQADLFEIKGYLEAVWKKLAIPQENWKTESYRNGYIADGLAYTESGIPFLVMGYVAGAVLKQFDVKQPVLYAEINWDRVLAMIPFKDARYREIPKFPEVRRDLALLVDQSVTFEQIRSVAFRAERKLLKQAGLFDVYEGEKISAGKKSYAVKFILQDDDKTLTDKEIEKSMDRILRALSTEINAQIR